MYEMDKNNMAMAIGILLMILLIGYVVYPVYFEQYVLMKIPEYSRLKAVISESKKTLDDARLSIKKYKDELGVIKKLAGKQSSTEGAEILERERKQVELEKYIESLKRELEDFTGLVANLKEQLKESQGYVLELKEIQDSGTKSMKEMNDLIIAEFNIPDKDLARRIQATRDSLLNILSTSRNFVCEFKDIALIQLAEVASLMREKKNWTTDICDHVDEGMYKRSWSGLKHTIFDKRNCPTVFTPWTKKQLADRRHPGRISDTQRVVHASETDAGYSSFDYGNCTWDAHNKFTPMTGGMSTLFDDVESTISYVIQNKFCGEDLKFRVDVFEEYYKKLINGMCKSDDWKKVTSKQLDYLMNKPATYLGESLT